MEELQNFFPFPNKAQLAINYLFSIFQEKNIIDPIDNTSPLEQSLGIRRFKATVDEKSKIDESEATDPEELEMIHKINSL